MTMIIMTEMGEMGGWIEGERRGVMGGMEGIGGIVVGTERVLGNRGMPGVNRSEGEEAERACHRRSK